MHAPSPPPNAPTPPAPRNAPPAFWPIARAFLATLLALFGDPSALAARRVIEASQRNLLLSWLRAGEALLRRLLLIEAASHPKPNAPAPPRAPRKRTSRLMAFTADNPEDWRVSFRFAAHRPRPRLTEAPARRAPKKPRFDIARFHNVWPLAERCEALLRVFNDPAPYARRLARRLHGARHGAHRAFWALAAAPANAPDLIGAEEYEAVSQAARAAMRTFDSTRFYDSS